MVRVIIQAHAKGPVGLPFGSIPMGASAPFDLSEAQVASLQGLISGGLIKIVKSTPIPGRVEPDGTAAATAPASAVQGTPAVEIASSLKGKSLEELRALYTAKFGKIPNRLKKSKTLIAELLGGNSGS